MFRQPNKSLTSMTSGVTTHFASKSLSELPEQKDFDHVFTSFFRGKAPVVIQHDIKDRSPLISNKPKNDIDQFINQVEHSNQKENKEESLGSQIPLMDVVQTAQIDDSSYTPMVISQVIIATPSQDIDEMTIQGEFTRSRSNSNFLGRKRALTVPNLKNDENFVSGLRVSNRDIDEYLNNK
eukprot:NODE_178_length_14069_cov_0.746815.p11 type:complete len:181 gc:universal NODE_178_length_14069_cov_0.746815:9695-10237(+)